MLSSFFGSEGSSTLQFALIFAVIVALLAVIVLVVKRLSGGGLGLGAKAGQRGRQPRLGIVDVYELDRQRQLILLRRDNVEHLLLVGGPNDVVVERNITRGLGNRLPAEPETRTGTDPAPAAEPERSPPAFLAPPLFPEPPYPAPANARQTSKAREPDFAASVAVPPPPPGPAAASGGRPLEMPSSGPEPDGFEPEAPTRAERPAPPPAPEPPPVRLFRRTPPPLVNPRPDVASERARIADASPPASEPEPPATPPPAVPAPPRAVDASILSDMARQFEEALRRPATPVPPPPARPDPVAPMAAPAASEPVPDPIPPPEEPPDLSERPVDPIAAAMAGSRETSAGEGSFAYDEPRAAPVAEDEPRSEPQFEAEFELKPEPAAPFVAAPAPPPAAPAPKPASQNPFSVEEIEAEFARLLGRPLDRKG